MKPEHEIVIHIDKRQYKVTQPTMTGVDLRNLANPKIGQDRDLFLEVPGQSDDQKIGDSQSVELKNGMHFYSAPKNINPGN